METVIERQRRMHEELERIEQAMTDEREYLSNCSVQRDRINSEHRSKMLSERYCNLSQSLHNFYEDRDGMRREELMRHSGHEEFTEFYRRLKHIKDFHKKFPNDIEEPMSAGFTRLEEERMDPELVVPIVTFSDEEGFGRYIDLHESHRKFCSLKGIFHMDYLTYLSTFDRLADIKRDLKNSDYLKYLYSLKASLSDVLDRIHPLLNIEKEIMKVHVSFEDKWNKGQFMGWEKGNLPGSAMIKPIGTNIDLSHFLSREQLAKLGMGTLKSLLQARGLKCGGTLEERVERLYKVKDMPRDHWDSSVLARTLDSKEYSPLQREIASLEAEIYWFGEQLWEQREASKENVERKLSRTVGEHEDDSSGSESSAESEDEEMIYNPKGIQLGWDGKPIPYWLYKLHGLNISYNCEICGQAVYKGPKAFQRHFSEYRHAYGMRKLGIPNTAHFANVTHIEDALALWEKVRNFGEDTKFESDRDIEYEDSLGNVINRKTYDDLRRQGLL
ncbi:Splicing factor 3A subunit 3 [Oopsacas minuta]|uniref:Splicing factor 3A subunit 3 n=1 Tax=Oopsacas minuta TaxID=111878 RepID=A0AAV7K6L2_9METZ|nr:Splicing factor 3A subunit 3 [Oopsacas minuta]